MEKMMINLRQRVSFYPVKGIVSLAALFIILSGNTVVAQLRFGDNLGTHKATRSLNMNNHNIDEIGSLRHRVIDITDKDTGGDIGTAAATVDTCSVFSIDQNTANQTLSLPTPKLPTAGRMVYVMNAGSASFSIAGANIKPGDALQLIYNGNTWNVFKGDQQNVSVGAPSGTAYDNGGIVSGNSLSLSYADGTHPGMVSTSAQTFGGDKTFSSDVAVNGGDVTTTATTASVFNTAATTLNVGGAATALNLGASTGTTIVNGNLTLATGKNLIFTGATSGTVTFKPTTVTTSYTLTLPGSQGASTQTVVNDGLGNLSWGYGLINQANYGTNSLMVGSSVGTGVTAVSNSNFLGTSAGSGATNAYGSNFLGTSAGSGATNASYSNFLGPSAGQSATSAFYSNFFGTFAGQGGTTASNSNFFGQSAGYNAAGAKNSNFLGFSAGNGAAGASNSNFFGQYAGYGATNVSNSNFLGISVGYQATSASYSTLLGYNVANEFAGSHIGSNNIVIGTNITLPAATTNGLNIGGVLFGTGTYSTTAGDPVATAVSSGKIGIGVVTPTARLQLPAGGSAAGLAPLKLTAGINLGTTEAGAIEYDGAHLYFSATNGGTRSQLDQQGISLGAPSGTTYTNGGIVTGGSLSLSYADGTNPGMVSTAAQTIAGVKTFSSDITTTGDVAVNGGDVTTTATTATVFNTAATTLNMGGAATALNLGGTTGTTTVNNNLTVAANKNFAQSGTGTFATGTGAVSLNGNATLAAGKNLIFTGAASGTVTLQPTTSTTSYTLTLPGSQGASTQTVVNDGLGNLSWGYGLINQANSGTYSVMVGQLAGLGAATVSYSNFFGASAGSGATGATNSNFLGYSAGNGATGATNSNFLGYLTGYKAINASNSTLLGYEVANEVGGSHIGSNNIIIGTNITLPAATANGLNIGGVLFGTGTYSTTAGDPLATAVSSGKIGIGVVTPTARLQLPAGASAAGLAPLKLTAGINLGTTEAGAIEYDGSHLYFSATNGGTRSQLDQQGITLGAPSGTTYANGGVVSGSVLNLSYADGTYPGLVSINPQTFAGAKTFNADITTTGDVAVNGGDVTTTATTATVFNTNATTLNVGGAATVLNLGAASGTTTVNNNLKVVGSTILGTTTATNTAATYSINAATVNSYSGIIINQSSVPATLNIATPTDATAGRIFTVSNNGTYDLMSVYGNICPNTSATFVYNGVSWSSSLAAIGRVNGVNNGYNLMSSAMGAGGGVTDVSFSNFFGVSAGAGATSASYSNFLGGNAGKSATNAAYSNFLGWQAGESASLASYSTLIGYNVANERASFSNIGSNNIIIGTNITLPDATANALNIGGVLFGTGTHASPSGDPTATAVAGGKIGIGVEMPTARLQLPPGASGAGLAPLKLTAGTNLGTTEAGAIEYDGSHLYFSATNGGTRSQLDQQGITLGAPSGTTYANGGVVSGSVLNLSYADGTNPGLVSTAAQTIAGAKTFNADITTTGDVAVNGGDVTTTATTATVFNTNATTLNVGGAATTLNLGAALGGITTVNSHLTVAANKNFAQSGTGTFFTGTGGVFLNGITTVSNAVLKIGTPSTGSYGTIVLENGSSSAYNITLKAPSTALTASRTITLPDATGTIALAGKIPVAIPVGTSAKLDNSVVNGGSTNSSYTFTITGVTGLLSTDVVTANYYGPDYTSGSGKWLDPGKNDGVVILSAVATANGSVTVTLANCVAGTIPAIDNLNLLIGFTH